MTAGCGYVFKMIENPGHLSCICDQISGFYPDI